MRYKIILFGNSSPSGPHWRESDWNHKDFIPDNTNINAVYKVKERAERATEGLNYIYLIVEADQPFPPNPK